MREAFLSEESADCSSCLISAGFKGWEMGPEEEGEPWASEAMRVELSILGMQVDW